MRPISGSGCLLAVIILINIFVNERFLITLNYILEVFRGRVVVPRTVLLLMIILY